uniref:Uncharacterized protein n=1 Tax=Oryza sativa subsp. japonica TaxID=39947 RepID=Q6ZKI5_ORYSJ|nr:hypothetical protein [Oryza sativa Japonica Group]
MRRETGQRVGESVLARLSENARISIAPLLIGNGGEMGEEIDRGKLGARLGAEFEEKGIEKIRKIRKTV